MRISRGLVLLVFALALGPPGFAQFLPGVDPITGTINSAGATCAALVMDSRNSGPSNCVSEPLPSAASSASIVLSGTFSATVQFEISADSGRTWVAAPTASSTSAGTTNFQLNGYNGVRARASAYSSGSITTTITVGVGAGSGSGGFGCSGSLGALTCASFTTSANNGGISGTEGTCAGLTPATGLDLLCPSSTGGPLGVSGWLANMGNGGWASLFFSPSLVPAILPVGSSGTPSLAFTGHTDTGLYWKSTNVVCYKVSTDTCDIWFGGSNIQLVSGSVFGWASSTTDATTADTALSRQGAGIVDVGNGANQNTSGEIRSAKIAATYNAAGTLQTAVHLVRDTGTLVGGTLTVTLTGSAAYTSSSTYTCAADDSSGLFGMDVTYTSGSSVTFNGNSTDTFRYLCVGN